MNDPIERQAAIDAVNSLIYPSSLVDVKRKLIDLPSAQPERNKGEWVLHTYMPHHNYCSECGKDSPYNKRWGFCPNCGADMRGENDE